MRILFFFSHPAQFLFLKNPVIRLREKGHEVFILIKTKDVLSSLLDEMEWEYFNILPHERGRSKISILRSLLIRDRRVLKFARKNRIDLLIGTDASLAHAGKLLGIPCITTTEDDFGVIRNLANLTYPFTSHILAPNLCDVGMWSHKKIGYEGYMKLAYLHPNVFTPDRSRVALPEDKPFFLIRLSGLTAHHDFGAKGIRMELLDRIIQRLGTSGSVFISSEKPLPAKYDGYRLKIPVSDIHHYLWYSGLLVCDSQSMSVESAMLGTPSIRISTFSGRISVLEELEKKYRLTFGIQPDEEEKILQKLDELLSMKDLRERFRERRQKMLDEKIDVSAFLTGLIHHYPYSVCPAKRSQSPVRDFTPSLFRELLETLREHGYEIQTFLDFLTAPAKKTVILRHDVDARPGKSLEFARLEHFLGIRGTYYFRAHKGDFQPGIIRQVAAMGHEIGYHYEDLRLSKGDSVKAISSFQKNLAALRNIAPVQTICMDGQTLSGWNNLDLWKKSDYREFHLLGEPYLDVDFNQTLYLTDTGRRWNVPKFSRYDKVETRFSYKDKSTRDLLHDLASGELPDQIMITVHPQRWNEGIFSWSYEYGSQWIKNRIKYLIIKRRSLFPV